MAVPLVLTASALARVASAASAAGAPIAATLQRPTHISLKFWVNQKAFVDREKFGSDPCLCSGRRAVGPNPCDTSCCDTSCRAADAVIHPRRHFSASPESLTCCRNILILSA